MTKRDQALLVAALGVGALLRLVHYMARPSLLIDEARIALNVGSRSWLGLLRPLDYDQTAPILFLWATKLVTRLGGTSEYALRALPFLTGLAVLPLIFVVARRVQGVAPAILAVAVAAVSPLLIQYSGEIKPYTLDLLVTLALVWLAFRAKEAPAEPARRVWLLFGGVLAVWASAPAAFTLAAIVAALLVAPGEPRVSRRFVSGAAVAWGLSLAAAYGIVYRSGAVNPYMQQFWQGSLLTIWKPGVAARAWQGLREVLWALFVGGTTEPPLERADDLSVHIGAGALLLVAIAGTARLRRAADWDGLLLIVGPLVAGIGASLIGGYPVAARVMVYGASSLLIAFSAGCVGLAESSPARRRMAGLAVSACALAPPLPRDVALAARPGSLENVRSAVAEFDRQARPGEPVYVFAATLPAWTFYTTDWTAPDTVRLARMARLASSGGPAFENAPPRGRAIHGEGDSLAYPYRGHREVLGLFHGGQWRAGTGLVQHQPDTNWTDNEVRRIRAAADPRVWILISHSYALERFLYPALEQLGGRLEFAYGQDGVELRRYAFP